ncbi:FAD/NAD(P)-binding protein [bacterium]|nr:FAD/NAD(P)-binding protein [bacterium]
MPELKIAVVGGGPSALFILKRLVQSGRRDLCLHIFERKSRLGLGMPYGPEGAGLEHITNVSSNELPELPQSLLDWVQSLPHQELEAHGLSPGSFSEEKVLPRLLFGRYLEAQFHNLLAAAGFPVEVHTSTPVLDVVDLPERPALRVVSEEQCWEFDRVVVCTGHHWPRRHEGKVPGYFDSPYPPAKLQSPRNHPIALRGGSLTAVDAVRTLARQHGSFLRQNGSTLVYQPRPGLDQFKLVLHTRNGLLPCVRFYLEDPRVHSVDPFSSQEVEQIKADHGGFVPLDLVFHEYFKKLLLERDPALYAKIKDWSLEEFVQAALEPRQESDPFAYFQAEYRESLNSLAQERSIPWKEVLAILSFALNYPAKHFCAEDMLRLKRELAPLIAIVIAFVPQSSSQEMLALHAAGRLELLEVGADSEVEIAPEGGIFYSYTDARQQTRRVAYQTFVDCIGQPPLPLQAFPFPSLLRQGVVNQARLPFRSQSQALQHQQSDPENVQQDEEGKFYLIVPGIAISDAFQPLQPDGRGHSCLYLMSVPFMSGHNPDYSGLDFCEEASDRIVNSMLTGPNP